MGHSNKQKVYKGSSTHDTDCKVCGKSWTGRDSRLILKLSDLHRKIEHPDLPPLTRHLTHVDGGDRLAVNLPVLAVVQR